MAELSIIPGLRIITLAYGEESQPSAVVVISWSASERSCVHERSDLLDGKRMFFSR